MYEKYMYMYMYIYTCNKPSSTTRFQHSEVAWYCCSMLCEWGLTTNCCTSFMCVSINQYIHSLDVFVYYRNTIWHTTKKKKEKKIDSTLSAFFLQFSSNGSKDSRGCKVDQKQTPLVDTRRTIVRNVCHRAKIRSIIVAVLKNNKIEYTRNAHFYETRRNIEIIVLRRATIITSFCRESFYSYFLKNKKGKRKEKKNAKKLSIPREDKRVPNHTFRSSFFPSFSFFPPLPPEGNWRSAGRRERVEKHKHFSKSHNHVLSKRSIYPGTLA